MYTKHLTLTQVNLTLLNLIRGYIAYFHARQILQHRRSLFTKIPCPSYSQQSKVTIVESAGCHVAAGNLILRSGWAVYSYLDVMIGIVVSCSRINGDTLEVGFIHNLVIDGVAVFQSEINFCRR